MFTQKEDTRKVPEGTAMPDCDYAAIKGLAEHLGIAAQELEDWLRQAENPPAKVLLSWIYLWDLERRGL